MDPRDVHPYLSHSDPTVERRTGLIPTYGSDTDLGQFISTPYYINIAPNMDATVTPTVTTGEGVVGAAEPHPLQNTAYTIDGSLTYASKAPATAIPRGAISGATCCTNSIPNGGAGRKSLCRLTIPICNATKSDRRIRSKIVSIWKDFVDAATRQRMHTIFRDFARPTIRRTHRSYFPNWTTITSANQPFRRPLVGRRGPADTDPD